MRGQSAVYETLHRLGIFYDGREHKPVFTVEQFEQICFPQDVGLAKNLFLRDAKGRRHFLVLMRAQRPVDLKGLERHLGSSRLSFGSEQRLEKYLGLTKGAVSPLGLINDPDNAVEAVFDTGLADYGRVAVHPNDNAATLFIKYGDLVRLAEAGGRTMHYI